MIDVESIMNKKTKKFFCFLFSLMRQQITRYSLLITFYFSIFLFFYPISLFGADLLITEVAPDEDNGYDWVEIFVNKNNYNIANISLNINDYQSATPSPIVVFSTAALPSGFGTNSLPRGTHIVVNLNKPIKSYSKISDNLYVVNTDFTRKVTTPFGISGSEGIVHLMDASTNYIDAVVFNDGSVLEIDVAQAYDKIVSTGQWGPAGAVPENCVRFRLIKDESEPGRSIVRKKRNLDGTPVDTNTKDDWSKSYAPSPGGGYNLLDTSMPAVVVVKEPNPFSPKAMNPALKSASISYDAKPADGNWTYKTMKIYNVLGRVVKVLMNNDHISPDKGTLSWDGTDEAGNLLPTGIYIVWFESVEMKGLTEVGRKTAKGVIAIGSEQTK